MKPVTIFLAASALFASVAPMPAQTFEAPEPMFRMITPPGPDHQGPRVNIWIEPQPQTQNPEPEAEAEPLADVDGPSGWFWAVVPAALDQGAGRANIALEHLAAAPQTQDLPIARLDDLQAIAREHGRAILSATLGTEVSPALVLAVIAVESSGRRDAVSHAGAQGLMQLIPATADRFGVDDPFDPAQNIAGGVAYLDWLLNEFGQDHILALAGYNAGEGAVRANGGVPNYAETRDYVPKVLATWALVRGLCQTPPEFLRDGCVFYSMSSS